MTVLNWEPIGRKVTAALAELGRDEEWLFAKAEAELSMLMDQGMEDPYEMFLHVFGEDGSDAPPKGPQFIITPSVEEENMLRIDLCKHVNILDQIFPDGIPADHPMATMADGGPVKGLQMPEPDYDEEPGALN